MLNIFKKIAFILVPKCAEVDQKLLLFVSKYLKSTIYDEFSFFMSIVRNLIAFRALGL